jgi:signal peptidase II
VRGFWGSRIKQLSVESAAGSVRKVPAGLAAFVGTAATVFAIAQVGSYVVQDRLPLHDSFIVNAVLHFTHIRNTGGVFGLFPDNVILFAVISGLIMLGFGWYVLKNKTLDLYQYVCFGLIVGATASNICDRIVYGAVIDFIDVQGIPYWGYVFNIADVAIHLGAWPLAIGTLVSKR